MQVTFPLLFFLWNAHNFEVMKLDTGMKYVRYMYRKVHIVFYMFAT